jgi:phosphomannomutase / phosphoglucomutase
MCAAKVEISDEIFRAYDIRGIVGEGLNDDVMTLIGRAIGSEALDQGERNLILAADARLSSPAFSIAIKNGILSTGCDVTDIGVVPTPLMYFATHILETGSGLMITGSHNPKDYNGVKVVLKRECLTANQITMLKERIKNNDLHSGQGHCTTLNLKEQYIERIARDIKLKLEHKIVVDCGNGVASLIAPDLFTHLGCQVIPLYCEPDGNFPNHHPDPTNAKNLEELILKVKAEQADLGIAFDGDGDRVGLISNTGNIIDADKMMMSFINDILPENPAAKIIFDVKSSQQLGRLIEDKNGQAIMCKSGHSFVKRKMQESGALLGGEYSAHIFFKHRWYGFDDGLYVAARFLELMDKNICSSQALLARLPENISTPELFITVQENEKFQLMGFLQKNMAFLNASINKLDGIRADFTHGWGLIRASNTTPKLVLRFEADSDSALNEIIMQFKQEISRLKPELEMSF